MPRRWIGRNTAEDEALLRWPPRSPDITPCDFSFGDTLKGSFYRLYHRIGQSCEDESSPQFLCDGYEREGVFYRFYHRIGPSCEDESSPPFLCDGYEREGVFYRLYHRIGLSCEDESSPPFQCDGYERNWIVGLSVCHVAKSGCMQKNNLRVSLSICRSRGNPFHQSNVPIL